MRPFDLDKLNAVDAERAGQSAFRVVNALQDLTPEQQVAGATLAFAALVDKYDLRHSEALRVADNIMRQALHRVPELRALLAYVAGEL